MKVKKKTLNAVLYTIIAVLVIIGVVVGIKALIQPDPEPVVIENDDDVIYGDDFLGIDAGVDKALKNYTNILIAGIDTKDIEDHENNRSDAIVILSINEKNDEVKMFSVYRDTYLKLSDDNGLDKVNHAYAFDGMNGSMYALNRNLDLNIRDTIAITWETVETMVDELNGITITIESSEISAVNAMLSAEDKIYSAGEQTLNGDQAVAYCRARMDSSDVRRNERFKDVLAAAFEKSKTLETNARVQLADEMIEEIESNMPNMTVIDIILELTELDIVSSTGFPYDKKGWTYSSIYYLVPVTLESNVIKLHEEIFGQDGYEPTETVKKISSEIHDKTGY